MTPKVTPKTTESGLHPRVEFRRKLASIVDHQLPELDALREDMAREVESIRPPPMPEPDPEP